MQIEEVDVATPKGKVLARRLTAAVPFDEGLLVTGPNGSGALLLVFMCKPVPWWQTTLMHMYVYVTGGSCSQQHSRLRSPIPPNHYCHMHVCTQLGAPPPSCQHCHTLCSGSALRW